MTLNDKRPVIGCECGKVEFTTGPLRFRVMCCCVDCNDAFRWAEKQGGPPHPGAQSDSIYFDNDIVFSKGEEHVGFYRLNEGYPTVRMVANCCYTTMIGSHPGYLGNVFVSYYCKIKLENCVLEMEPQLRLSTDDVPEEHKDSLQPDSVYKHGSYPNLSPENLQACLGVMGPAFAPPPKTNEGAPVESFIEKKGVTTINWTPTNGVITPFRAPPAGDEEK